MCVYSVSVSCFVCITYKADQHSIPKCLNRQSGKIKITRQIKQHFGHYKRGKRVNQF